jgi:hypothetical protein
MKRTIIFALALSAAPLAALAMPEIGDVVGTNPKTASAELEKLGCKVRDFEAEAGMIEAKCVEVATNKNWEVYIDPQSGAVANIKDND